MAIKMATPTLVPVFVAIMLASQWTTIHARSMPGDFDTQEFVPTNGAYEEFDPQDLSPDADTPSFATDSFATDSFATESDPTPETTWDAETFATRDTDSGSTRQSTYNYDSSFATTEAELPLDTFVDSPETVTTQDTSASFADDSALEANTEVVYSQSAYENDEVFFDTSNADTVYRANDDGLSLSSTDVVNDTSVDATLASLAAAMGGCGTGNPIDDCWRCDPNWRSHRQALASCAIGFGRNAIGGKNGPIYTVTNNGDDLQNPQPGTLRYGVTRNGPLWIIFAKSMTIQLKGELWVTAFKTLDGRGAEVHITGTSQITIQNTNNVILHGLHIHDIKPSGPSVIRASPMKVIRRGKTDGDGIHILGSHDVWVDHCYLAKATDGLLDATRGSTMITVSNCLFENHNKVMLFGANPMHTMDRNMRATVAFNKFGGGLIQRLPRCRFGTFHILNNDYSAGWSIYAIGGSEDPTILSQGNLFNPSGKKEVTKRIDDAGPTFGGWKTWDWASSGDVFLKGAFFTGSGAKATSAGVYAKAFSTSSRPGSMVPAMTRGAGPLKL
ncbi:hypothetical protein KC19_11G082500 [Ceratodon purpureus]|uniref:Pectate lyase n=1 Tax=Ceratodon purpureus TaxID=3225 RepID=A0A8T0GEU6_CERPU|nr:hypothetical protein KC19_11G082500 [Ceratodon purpureus]